MTEQERTLCSATAALLRASAAGAAWGLGLALVAALVLALTGRSLPAVCWAAFALVALAGLAERYLALRLRFEQALFDGLAHGDIASLPLLDGTLDRLGLRRAGGLAEPLAARVLAARLSIQRHGMVVILQTVVFVIALALQDPR